MCKQYNLHILHSKMNRFLIRHEYLSQYNILLISSLLIIQSLIVLLQTGASLVAQLVKKSTCNERDLSSIPGLGKYPGEGEGYLLQYSGLENSQSMGSQRVGQN